MAANGDREFETRRRNALRELYDMDGDRSRKGSVDAPIQALVDLINAHPHMFTTSSCSGRISCFSEPTAETRAAGLKGGEWVYASHDAADAEEVLVKVTAAATKGSCLVFRMEPFVMHVECRSIEWSAVLLARAREAGFRESGMVPSLKGRYMVGIRCNLRLEAPIADAGVLLVNEAYIRYLVNMANVKFVANAARHESFLKILQDLPHGLDKIADAATRPKWKESKYRPNIGGAHYQTGRKGGQGKGRGERRQGTSGAMIASSTASGAPAKEPTMASREDELAARQLELLERITVLENQEAWLQLDKTHDDNRALLLRSLELRCPGHAVFAKGGQSKERVAERRQVQKKKKTGTKGGGQDLNMLELGRWGLSATHVPGLPGQVVVFGGFGGTSAHKRHGDLLLVNLVTGTLTRPPVALGLRSPSARCYHSAVPVGQHHLLVIGGRVGPTAPLADGWLLDTRAWSWAALQNSALPPRFRHSADVIPVANGHMTEQVLVFGGCSGDGDLLGDAWILDTTTWQWREAEVQGSLPAPRHSHASAVVADGRVFIYGGLASRAPHGLADLHCLTRQLNGVWTSVRISLPHDAPPHSPWPPPSFSASLTAVPALSGKQASVLVLLGGCSTLNHRQTFTFDTGNMTWNKHSLTIHSPRSYAAVRHAACFVPYTRGLSTDGTGVLCVVGGGAVCFAFGTIQGGLHILDAGTLFSDNSVARDSSIPDEKNRWTKHSRPGNKDLTKSSRSDSGEGWVMVLPKRHAKQMKDALKRAGWLDQSRKGGELSDSHVVLPLHSAGAEVLKGGHLNQCSAAAEQASQQMLVAGGKVEQRTLTGIKRVESPAKRLREAVSSLLQAKASSLSQAQCTAMLEQLPIKWERLGEMVLLPAGSCEGAEWRVLPQAELWRVIAKALQASKLARQAPVASTGTRCVCKPGPHRA